MPAKSKKQRMAAGPALAAKLGKRSKASLKGASRGMYKSMSKKELRRMAKTKRKGNRRKSDIKKSARAQRADNGRAGALFILSALSPSPLSKALRLPCLFR